MFLYAKGNTKQNEYFKSSCCLLETEIFFSHCFNHFDFEFSTIQTKEGVLYLSMIRDLYDRSIVAYKTDTSQTVNLHERIQLKTGLPPLTLRQSC